MATKKKGTSSSGVRNKSNTAKRKQVSKQQAARDVEMFREIKLVVLFVVFIALFLCNFGILGLVGNALSNVMFGIFGLTAYIAPVLIYLGILFWHANIGNATAVRKLVSGFVLFMMVGVVCDIISDICIGMIKYNLVDIYKECSEKRNGGGVIAGSLSFLLNKTLSLPGTILIVILLTLISLILLTEKSFLGTMKNGKEILQERHSIEKERRREYAELREEAQREQLEKRELIRQRREEEREQQRLAKEEERQIKEKERRAKEKEREQKEEERRLRAEEKENEQILRMDKRARGVMVDTSLKRPSADKKRDDVHEIILDELSDEDGFSAEENYEGEETPSAIVSQNQLDLSKINIRTMHQVNPIESTEAVQEDEVIEDEMIEEVPIYTQEVLENAKPVVENPLKPSFHGNNAVQNQTQSALHPSDAAQIKIHSENSNEPAQSSYNMKPNPTMTTAQTGNGTDQGKTAGMVSKAPKKPAKEYKLPPLSLLKPGPKSEKDPTEELRETAIKLQETLQTFGVKVEIKDVSQGPSVTRYELLPEPGVKVSKITNLQEDIKLYLAAADIRIEAPIPGKSAVGIEVPNKVNMMVALRDLLESKEFKNFDSKIAFAVGKDIGGQTIVSDIAKMPHMLIAGSTGSGKSVCINTLIMSILYKAKPDEVKLIMVDPKVVELSVYNGIPHLLIPVVTDPKKASAALHWGVSEMEDRYRKFADFNVRDLKGYNKKLQEMPCEEGQEPPKPLPQIVIIVDELADLMMVCPGEVEESICRLAQLARAAGIHLIIATQRPSVDVITGLIKANMPSRVAFAVSSGVDSRTILDMNGAEKLLGKGDMLFYPQGYTKPARIQGAFVSDGEVGDVVDYLKNQQLGNTYEEAQEIEKQMMSMSSGSSSASNPGAGDDGRDELFRDAGKFIIDKDKASIGMLQRVFKIGFNRAARIMDQLCEYGVVGEEEGTKPRKVLMSMEQFEQLLEEI